MSTNTDILDFLKSLIVDMKYCNEDAIHWEASFQDLELDSLDFVELQVAVKKKFQVNLVEDVFANGNISNIGQLVNFIENESAIPVT